MSEPHPQQWLLDQMLEAAAYERRLTHDANGNPMRSHTLAEIEAFEAQSAATLAEMRAGYEAAQAEGNRYREAAEFIKAAMERGR